MHNTSHESDPDAVDTDGADTLDEHARSWLDDQLAAVAAVATSPAPAGRSSTGRADARLLALLGAAEARGASDLHVSVDAGVHVRNAGRMEPLAASDLPGRTELTAMLESCLRPDDGSILARVGSVDGALTLDSGRRVRTSLFRGADGLCGAFRLLRDEVPSLADLGIPAVVAQLAAAPRGLLLVTGPTGSGKTTTIAALIEQIVGRNPVHIVTIEDPIEYRLAAPAARITQRQVGEHAPDFPTALTQAMRQDPDVIMIGEMRDPETISAALAAAETGHFVTGTLHSRSAQGAVSRIVESFADGRQDFVRAQLASALVGIVSQQLLPQPDSGWALATEVLVMSSGVSSMIREGKLHQIDSAIETGASMGMHTMDRSLINLARQGRITPMLAIQRSIDAGAVEAQLR